MVIKYGRASTIWDGIPKFCMLAANACAYANIKLYTAAITGFPLAIIMAATARKPRPADMFSVKMEVPPKGRMAPAIPTKKPVIKTDYHL